MAIHESIRNIQSQIQAWKNKYLLSSADEGVLHYLMPLQLQDVINAGDELFAIMPSTYHRVAYVTLPSTGLGKVKINQRVQIALWINIQAMSLAMLKVPFTK